MTDRQSLLEMFKRNKISFEVREDNSIAIEAGYIGFVSIFSFDENGNLKSVEAYE